MGRAGRVAAVIALAGLLAGWVLVEALAGRPRATTVPVVETVGFAVSTPAAIAFTTYLSGVFAFERYYADRERAGMVGDFVLAVLAGAIVGLAASSLVDRFTGSPTVTFVVASVLTFVGAFVTFLSRTRGYQDWEAPSAE